MSRDPSPREPRKVTGRMVLFGLIGFFAVVAGVNAIMVRAAVSTFAGTETDSAYRAGLAYKHEEAAAKAQAALNWTVEGRIDRGAEDAALLTVEVKDARGNVVSGLDVDARLSHPLDARLDRAVALVQQSNGQYRGVSAASAGQWRLFIDIRRGGERVYRTTSRVVLK